MSAGRVACCPLVSHTEYALRTLLKLEQDGTDRRTDADRYVTLFARRDQRNNIYNKRSSVNITAATALGYMASNAVCDS